MTLNWHSVTLGWSGRLEPDVHAPEAGVQVSDLVFKTFRLCEEEIGPKKKKKSEVSGGWPEHIYLQGASRSGDSEMYLKPSYS